MVIKMSFLIETPLTEIALISLISLVCQHMSVQISFAREHFIAVWTRVVLGRRVCGHVSFEVVTLSVGLSTHVAHVRFFVAVNEHVLVEIGFVVEPLLTVFTLERFVT